MYPVRIGSFAAAALGCLLACALVRNKGYFFFLEEGLH